MGEREDENRDTSHRHTHAVVEPASLAELAVRPRLLWLALTGCPAWRLSNCEYISSRQRIRGSSACWVRWRGIGKLPIRTTREAEGDAQLKVSIKGVKTLPYTPMSLDSAGRVSI